jgi:hypothetical protein
MNLQYFHVGRTTLRTVLPILYSQSPGLVSTVQVPGTDCRCAPHSHPSSLERQPSAPICLRHNFVDWINVTYRNHNRTIVMASEGDRNSREIPAQPQAPIDSRNAAANEDKGDRNSREIPARPQAPIDSRSAANEDNISVGTYDTSYSRDSQRNRGYPTKRRRGE